MSIGTCVRKGLIAILNSASPQMLVDQSELDTIIRIDCSVLPVYPGWTKEVMHPELETVGPAEYDLAKVELFLHDGQKTGGWVKGTDIYEYLKRTDSLKNCLGLRDAQAIAKKDFSVYQKLFGRKAVFCWKSVVRDAEGNLGVPHLCEHRSVVFGSMIVVTWFWLNGNWRSDGPAARFVSE